MSTVVPFRRPAAREGRTRFEWPDTATSERSVYARPDVYDMEYAGASNEDARFFAKLLARGVRVAFVCGSGILGRLANLRFTPSKPELPGSSGALGCR